MSKATRCDEDLGVLIDFSLLTILWIVVSATFVVVGMDALHILDQTTDKDRRFLNCALKARRNALKPLVDIRTEMENRAALKELKLKRNWISPELLEVIESVPYHEHFIHTYEGALPRG